MLRATALVFALTFVSGMALSATDVVIPAVNEFANANTQSNTPLRESGNPRSLQIILGRPATDVIPPGSLITGVSFRAEADGTGAWPAAALSFSSYQISVASAANPATSFSTTFANNQLSDTRAVYSGPLAIGAGAYPGGAPAGGVNAFGPIIPFSTPFLFSGQDLAITIRHPGSSGAAGTVRFLDALNNTSPPYGVGGIAAISATSATAVTGSGAPAPVVRVRFTPPGLAPASAAPVASRFIPGTVDDTLTFSNNGRVLQWVLDARVLGDAPVGSTIEGMRFRLGAEKPAWPAGGAATFTQFDVSLARANTPASAMSEVFATNMGGDALLVRTGALSFGVGAPVAPELARPAPATLSVPFSSPYVYNGGGLAVLVRHSASGQSAPGLDALTGSVGVNAFAGATADATTGVAHPAPIVHLDVRSAAAIPVASATTAGAAQISTLLGTAPATMQIIIGADQLASIPPGSTIDGLSFRVRGATAWPAVSTITSRLDVTLATPGGSPGSMFASISQSRARPESRATLARSGPWAVSKDAFNASATIARRWSPMIRFDRPYTYVGGGLHVTIVSAGFPTGAGSAALDAQAAGSAGIQAGIATVIDADSTSVDAPAPIMRVHFTPGVARPASAGLLAGEFSGSGVFSSVGGRLQYVIGMDDLPAFASPLPLTGLAFRAAQGAAGGVGGVGGGPAGEVRIANFRVRVGPAAVSPDAISARFDENAGDAGTKLVRSGAMTIPAFALRSSGVDGVPAPASFVIPFDVPYLWRAGPLVITLEAEGVDGESLALESIAPSGAIGAVYAEDGVSERGQIVSPPVVVLMHAKHLWRSPADIADDQGNVPPAGVNNGVTESDYNVFVRVYFDNSIVADIADDQGNALPSELPNNGVTEGDYNLFFRAYFGL